MSERNRFDWPALMRLGLCDLGLKPDVFWNLSPAELRLLIGGETAGSALSHDGLAALMAAYPDTKKDEYDVGK